MTYQKQEEQDDHHRSYGPLSSRHKRHNLAAVAGAPDLSLRLKFSEIVLYKFTLALVDFVFTFLFIHTFTLFLSVSRTLYGIF